MDPPGHMQVLTYNYAGGQILTNLLSMDTVVILQVNRTLAAEFLHRFHLINKDYVSGTPCKHFIVSDSSNKKGLVNSFNFYIVLVLGLQI